MNGQIKRINPDGLMKNPAFSQVVTTQGSGKTIYIGGQNAVNENRELVGKGDIQAQTEQVMKNIQVALGSCGAAFDNLVKLSIHIVQGQNLYEAFQASQKFLNISNPPVITVLIVAGLANPDFLIEIDATAFISE
ncbi:MAG: RidA family protein [Bacteroidetes bacterium HGW-Bacteroidetes-6]|jgi:enamine deaminase RidA (YjgF/YER057c/UK114 family)|nr:MAG: RidA family protein [Bacteroidetes bacterium HGW-Bacteroidetes-6]